MVGHRFFKGICALVVLGAACGTNNNENNGVIPGNNPTNGGSNNGTSNDTNNATTTNNATNGGDESCDQIESFSDESVTIEREFFANGETTTLTCAGDVGEIATNGAYVVKVQYAADTTAHITVSAVVADGQGRPPRPGLEIRKGGCETGETIECATATSYDVEFEANVPYYLVFNGLLDSGGLSLDIDATTPICAPDEVTCTDGTLETCNADGTSSTPAACPADCDENACQGNRCEAPITISPEPNGSPIVLAGDRATFTSTWDAMAGAGCVLQEGQPPASTPGRDIFVLVEGVTAGQRVVVNADDSSGTYGFLVLDSCSSTTCAAAYTFDSNDRNRASHTATADGDVLFAVEALGDTDDFPFTIEVSVVE